MIEIDDGRCTRCGDCVDICHTECMSLRGEGLEIDYPLCSTCCQCIAICPEGALSWDGVQSREIEEERLPDYAGLLELLKARRTIRRYKEQPVEKEKLEAICRASRLAPTNVYDFELIVVTDEEVMDELEEICLGFVAVIYKLLYKPAWVFNLLKKLTPAMQDTDREKMEHTLYGSREIFHGAPSMIIVVANPTIAHAEASAQYAIYNMILTAQTLGLGSFIDGGAKMFLSRSRRTRRILNIPRGKNILGILHVGYPAVRFRRTVEGNYPIIHWIE